MALRLSVLSTEYINIPVTARENGVVIDPTGDTVALAFKGVDETPEPGDWVSGDWETDEGVYRARTLVGPGETELDVGTYVVWLKVSDNPETPVRRAGRLVIF